MTKLQSVLVLGAVMSLGGCNKLGLGSETSCSDPEGTTVAGSIILDEVAKQLDGEKLPDGSRLFDPSLVRATVAKLKVAFTDVRTTKKDPNSSKVFCTGTVQLTLPSELATEAEAGLRLTGKSNLRELAESYDLKANANVFSADMDYDLQPTDDGKSIFAEIDPAKSASFLHDAVGGALVKPIIEAKRAQATTSLATQVEQATAEAAPAVQPEQPEQPATDATNGQMVDGDGNSYTVSSNDNGMVLQSDSRTIYLGNSCEASSPGASDGTWGWANGGVSVTLGDASIGFPRQDSPFDDGRCPL